MSNICVDFGSKEVLNIEDLSIYDHERIAIIGNNGAGKSTLLKLLAGELTPHEGKISCFTDFSYIPQIHKEHTTQDIKRDCDLLKGTGLMNKCKGSYSGGERTTSRILDAISENKPTLLLDEPTTFLDATGIKQLIKVLNRKDITVIFVSHNIAFINALADKIWALEDGKIEEYYGNYYEYSKAKEMQLIEHERKRKQFLDKKKHLESMVEKKSKQAEKVMKVSKKKKKKNIKPNRLASTKQKDTVEKSINKSMKAAMKKIELLEEVPEIKQKREVVYPKAHFVQQHTQYPILLNELSLKVGERILLEKVSLQIKKGSKICITGDNGTGKTTLLNYIYNEGEQVELSRTSKIAYFSQHGYLEGDEDSVYETVKNLDHLPDSFIHTVLIHLGFSYTDFKRPTHTLSGGERIRLSLAMVFLRKSNLLFLDEPTTFLDIETKKSLEKMIREYPGTVLMVSHDKDFIENTSEYIYEIKDKALVLTREKEKKH